MNKNDRKRSTSRSRAVVPQYSTQYCATSLFFLFFYFLHIVGLEPELTQFENAPPTIKPQGPRCPSSEIRLLNPSMLRIKFSIRLFHNK